MAYDSEAFIQDFLNGQMGGHVFREFHIVRVEPDRVRQALDVQLEAPDGSSLVLFLERRVPGRAALCTTASFAVSYYPSRTIGDGEAAALGRAFAAFLEARETTLGPDAASRTLRLSSLQGTPDRWLELRINRECNERCVFCNTPENSETILPGPEAIEATLRAEFAAGHRAVLFTGREPTLDPRLLDYIRLSRALGYERVRLQTNGTRLAKPGYVKELIAVGVDEFEISFHTNDAATFEKLVGKRALLPKTEDGIERVLSSGARLHLVTVVTTDNLHQIPRLLRTLGSRFGGRLRHVTLSPMAPVGDGKGRLDLVPRLHAIHAALPQIGAAAAQAQIELSIPSRCGLPICVTPVELRPLNLETQNTPHRTLESDKHKAEQCSRCRYDSVCTGVWSAYLERHGSAELVPVSFEADAPGV